MLLLLLHAMPKQLVSYYDALVTQTDYDALDNGMWLNDNIISFAMEYLDRSNCHEAGSRRITLLDPSVCQAVKLTNQAADLLAGRGLRASVSAAVATRGLLCVVSDNDSPDRPGGSHWSLLAIRYKVGGGSGGGGCRVLNALHFDSLAGSNKWSAADLTAALHPALCDCPTAPVAREVADCAQQSNSFDCGAYALLFAERLIQAGPDGWPAVGSDLGDCGAKAVLELRLRYRRLIERLSADGPVYRDL